MQAAQTPSIQTHPGTQEPQMTQRAANLMDVLAPPENNWLKQLFRCKANLPAGVSIVRFSEAEDDPVEDGENSHVRRQKMAA
jgi:hypothetical protein